MNFKRIGRILVCFLVICCLIVNMSPIQAKATGFTTIMAPIENFIYSGMAGLGVLADNAIIDTGDGIQNMIDSFKSALQGNSELTYDEESGVYYYRDLTFSEELDRISVYTGATNSYYVSREFVELVQSWLWADEVISTTETVTVNGFSVSNISVRSLDGYFTSSEFQDCLHDAYLNRTAVVMGVEATHMFGFFWDDTGRLLIGCWENPLGVTHASVLGCYPLAELTLVNAYWSSSDYPIYYSQQLAEQSSGFLTSDVRAFDWSKDFSTDTTYCFYAYLFIKYAKDSTWSSSTVRKSVYCYANALYEVIGDDVFYGPASKDVVTWGTVTSPSITVADGYTLGYIGPQDEDLSIAYPKWYLNSFTVSGIDAGTDSDVVALPVAIGTTLDNTLLFSQSDVWTGATSPSNSGSDDNDGSGTVVGGTTSDVDFTPIINILDTMQIYQQEGKVVTQTGFDSVSQTLAAIQTAQVDAYQQDKASLLQIAAGFSGVEAEIAALPGAISDEFADVKTEVGVISGTLTDTKEEVVTIAGFLADVAADVKAIPQTIADAITEVLAAVFVPAEGYIDAKVETLTSKYAFADSIATTGIDLRDFLYSMGSQPPIIYIDLGATRGSYDIGDKEPFVDLTWYAEYKQTVDTILSAFLWLWFAWRMLLALPGIIQGTSGFWGAPQEPKESQSLVVAKDYYKSD